MLPFSKTKEKKSEDEDTLNHVCLLGTGRECGVGLAQEGEIMGVKTGEEGGWAGGREGVTGV